MTQSELIESYRIADELMVAHKTAPLDPDAQETALLAHAIRIFGGKIEAAPTERELRLAEIAKLF